MAIDHIERGVAADGLTMYEHQEEAVLDIVTGSHVIVTTPTGSGKSLIATAAHFACVAGGGRSYYTAPIKALVSEKFFALCEIFGAERVGMVTGDASVNPDAPIICCTAEILANIALREGRHAAVDQVIMDEFHFIGDPDRGWAWQVPLTELPQAQQIIMSATLGDVSQLAENLTADTGRPTEVITGVTRPVPLLYEWSMQPDHETIAGLVDGGKAPVYIVHPSQKAALERAQSLTSVKLVSTQERHEIAAEIADFRFSKGFGSTVRKFITAGIGVHHAGMLPKYRRLVETLAQQGRLKVICGTDTLGVGINVPIRTVMFTSLTKFDGSRMRVLKSREFHQIAGRAGRAGFDTVGYVVGQAPEHVVANAKALAKAGGDAKKARRIQKHKAPEGFVNYDEETFRKLIDSVPETLHARMRITDAMLLNLLSRDEDTVVAVRHLIDGATSSPKERRRLYRRALQLGHALLRSGVVHRLAEPRAPLCDERGVAVRLRTEPAAELLRRRGDRDPGPGVPRARPGRRLGDRGDPRQPDDSALRPAARGARRGDRGDEGRRDGLRGPDGGPGGGRVAQASGGDPGGPVRHLLAVSSLGARVGPVAQVDRARHVRASDDLRGVLRLLQGAALRGSGAEIPHRRLPGAAPDGAGGRADRGAGRPDRLAGRGGADHRLLAHR